MINIANEDYSLQYTPQSNGIPNPSPTKLENLSIKNKIGSGVGNLKKILTTILNLLQSGSCTMPGFTHILGTATITPTSTKCLAENNNVFRETDSAVCNGNFVNNTTGAIVPCVCNVQISYAGQSKVSGN